MLDLWVIFVDILFSQTYKTLKEDQQRYEERIAQMSSMQYKTTTEKADVPIQSTTPGK